MFAEVLDDGTLRLLAFLTIYVGNRNAPYGMLPYVLHHWGKRRAVASGRGASMLFEVREKTLPHVSLPRHDTTPRNRRVDMCSYSSAGRKVLGNPPTRTKILLVFFVPVAFRLRRSFIDLLGERAMSVHTLHRFCFTF